MIPVGIRSRMDFKSQNKHSTYILGPAVSELYNHFDSSLHWRRDTIVFSENILVFIHMLFHVEQLLNATIKSMF